MNFLLKIVEGPNAGAEIALTEGLNISLGRGDACDIILSDAALDEVACELEVTGERVMMIFPDGKQQRMENFHVVMLGTTELALGPAEGAWQPLVRAPLPSAETPATPAAPAPAPAAGPAAAEETKPADNAARPARRRKKVLLSVLIVAVLLFLGIGTLAVFVAPSDEDGTDSDTAGSWTEVFRSVLPDDPLPPPPPPSLEAIAKDYSLKVLPAKDGRPEIRGDFKTRSERLLATAKIFHTHPGTHVNFTDRESLRSAVENMLALVSDGRLKVSGITGRAVRFAGRVDTLSELQRVLRAVAADVPRIEKMTCEEVRVGAAETADTEPGPGMPSQSAAAAAADDPAFDEARRMAAARLSKEEQKPEMPVVGLLTAPYPCLVLRDGSRAVEGARFGDYTILSIQPDRVTLNGPEGKFVWRP